MVQTPISPKNLYPESDGKPMAENTAQYRWIARLVTNFKHLLRDQNAFVAGDLLWYPVQVEKPPAPCQAPDVMVVLGRPDGDRGSYKQWEEENIAPQVVFEIISPSNTAAEMVEKQSFYSQHGVLEMYFYTPGSHNFWGLVRSAKDENLTPLMPLNMPWVSPILGVRFKLLEDELAIFHPDGKPFKEPEEFALGEEQAQAERDKAQTERDKAFAKLRELGFDPSELMGES